jgi:hypothetical protein
MRRTLLFAGICCGTALLASQPLLAQTQNSTSLAGSWQFTLRSVSPAALALVPIEALATFTTDGSVVETDSTEVVPTTSSAGNTIYATPAHGIWQPAPAVGNLFIRFTSLLVNHNGTLHARKIVTISGALDSTGDKFKGSYGFELVDPTGRTIASGSGTVKGQRIPHPLLP